MYVCIYKRFKFSISLHFWNQWEDLIMMYFNTQEAWWKANRGYLDMKKEMNSPKQQMKCIYSLKHVRHVYAIAQM
jgi:hypothetical protein